MELHAVVMRERPHEPVRRQAEAALVEGHEAHDVAITWPWLWLAPRSNPLRSVGVGDRAEETIIDKRLQRRHGHVGWTPRIRLEDNSATSQGCGGERDYSGKACSLSLAFPPPSPFFSPALSSSVLSNRSRAERANAGRQGKEGRGEAHHVFMREGRG